MTSRWPLRIPSVWFGRHGAAARTRRRGRGAPAFQLRLDESDVEEEEEEEENVVIDDPMSVADDAAVDEADDDGVSDAQAEQLVAQAQQSLPAVVSAAIEAVLADRRAFAPRLFGPGFFEAAVFLDARTPAAARRAAFRHVYLLLNHERVASLATLEVLFEAPENTIVPPLVAKEFVRLVRAAGGAAACAAPVTPGDMLALAVRFFTRTRTGPTKRSPETHGDYQAVLDLFVDLVRRFADAPERAAWRRVADRLLVATAIGQAWASDGITLRRVVKAYYDCGIGANALTCVMPLALFPRSNAGANFARAVESAGGVARGAAGAVARAAAPADVVAYARALGMDAPAAAAFVFESLRHTSLFDAVIEHLLAGVPSAAARQSIVQQLFRGLSDERHFGSAVDIADRHLADLDPSDVVALARRVLIHAREYREDPRDGKLGRGQMMALGFARRLLATIQRARQDGVAHAIRKTLVKEIVRLTRERDVLGDARPWFRALLKMACTDAAAAANVPLDAHAIYIPLLRVVLAEATWEEGEWVEAAAAAEMTGAEEAARSAFVAAIQGALRAHPGEARLEDALADCWASGHDCLAAFGFARPDTPVSSPRASVDDEEEEEEEEEEEVEEEAIETYPGGGHAALQYYTQDFDD